MKKLELLRHASLLDEAKNYPSADEHEKLFQEVLAVLNKNNFKVEKRNVLDGFNADFKTPDPIESVSVFGSILREFYKREFVKNDRVDRHDLNLALSKGNVYVTLSITKKGVHVYCERIN